MTEHKLWSLALLVAVSGCMQSGASANSAAEAKKAENENMSGDKQRAMNNCPSDVAGAKTEIVDLPDRVELLITAAAPDAVTQIRMLAREQAKIVENIGDVQHTGTGTGRGTRGYCPIVHAETPAVVEDIEGGARVIMRPRRTEQIGELRNETRSRVEALTRGT